MDAGRGGAKLATFEELQASFLRGKQLEAAMQARQAGGASKSGRYKTHDTARKRCLERVVYPGLKMGKLPTMLDAKMLFEMEAPDKIHGPDKKTMDKWSFVYTRKAGAKDEALDLGVVGQTNLLLWASEHRAMSVLSPSARVPVGRPHALYTSYKLTFGGALVVGKTLDEISREQPWFIAWVCGKVRSENRFVMRFPAHEMLYLGLLELEQNAKKLVWEEGVERVSWTIKLSPDLKRNFEAHFIGAPGERRQNAEAYEERALAEEREDDADANPFVDGINRTANRVGEPTLAFLKAWTRRRSSSGTTWRCGRRTGRSSSRFRLPRPRYFQLCFGTPRFGSASASRAARARSTAGRTRGTSASVAGVRAQVAAGLMVNIGHSWVWVVGALFDVVHVNNLPPDCIPPLFRAWARTETRFDPLLKWGVQFDALGLQGSGGALPSPPHTGDDISKALATHASAEMLARRDVAAFERATGLATEVRHVDELADRVGKRSRARAALTEHGADEVRARLQTGSSGPAPAPLRGLLPSFNLGHIGPTPLCGTVGRLVLDAASTTIFAMELDAPSEFSGTILLARGRRKDCGYLLL